jgi:GrpB-like predicted nucleotidyltransferase (UPF0157 family)
MEVEVEPVAFSEDPVPPKLGAAQPLVPPSGRRVLLLEHDPRWSSLALQEAERIRAALPDQVVEIHHIGSTAIPGIRAKPILDLIMAVQSLDSLDNAASALEGLGYAARGEHGIPGRRYFTKGTGDARSHHLHVYARGDPQFEEHLLFCDYLRHHPEQAREYECLKLVLAKQFPRDGRSYAHAKGEFVRTVLEMAGRWKDQDAKEPGSGPT